MAGTRGLHFNEDKTKIVHVERDSPSSASTSATMSIGRAGSCSSNPAKSRSIESGNGSPPTFAPSAVPTPQRWLPPQPSDPGWSAYYRSVVSSRTFTGLDHYVWHLTYRWGRRAHPNKPRSWVTTRYFGMFNKTRKDRRVFGDRDSGAYLTKFSWVKIGRHVPVRGTASPDDSNLTAYWAERRRKHKQPPLDQHTLKLLTAQRGRCPLCAGLPASRRPRTTKPERVGTVVPGHPPGSSQAGHRATRRCPRRAILLPARTRSLPSSANHRGGRSPASDTSRTVIAHGACLSRVPGNRARTVLRGDRRSNAAILPDAFTSSGGASEASTSGTSTRSRPTAHCGRSRTGFVR